MPKPIELRKVIDMLKEYEIIFDSKTGGRHAGKFIKGTRYYPVKSHGLKTVILPYALKGLIKKFDLPDDFFQ
jgi:hypothetical protein